MKYLRIFIMNDMREKNERKLTNAANEALVDVNEWAIIESDTKSTGKFSIAMLNND